LWGETAASECACLREALIFAGHDEFNERFMQGVMPDAQHYRAQTTDGAEDCLKKYDSLLKY